jgi:hypothetical protein
LIKNLESNEFGWIMSSPKHDKILTCLWDGKSITLLPKKGWNRTKHYSPGIANDKDKLYVKELHIKGPHYIQ